MSHVYAEKTGQLQYTIPYVLRFSRKSETVNSEPLQRSLGVPHSIKTVKNGSANTCL